MLQCDRLRVSVGNEMRRERRILPSNFALDKVPNLVFLLKSCDSIPSAKEDHLKFAYHYVDPG